MAAIRGYIELRSIEPLPKGIVDNFTIGGYECKTQDGRTFGFDWNEMTGGSENDEEGHLIITCELRDFEKGIYAEENQKNGVDVNEITPEFIVSSQLTEAYYEAFSSKDEDTVYVFEIREFVIAEWQDTEQDYKYYEFDQENLERFNMSLQARVEDVANLPPDGWRNVSARLDKQNNILYINAKKSDFVPEYLKYVLQYMEIPLDAKIVFTKGE